MFAILPMILVIDWLDNGNRKEMELLMGMFGNDSDNRSDLDWNRMEVFDRRNIDENPMKILHEDNRQYDVHASMNDPPIERTYVGWNEILEFDFDYSASGSRNSICRETISFPYLEIFDIISC